MLKGSRDAILHRLQPISIHGQLSYDAHYTFEEDPAQPHVARIGPEAVDAGVEAGDRVRLDFLVGVVIQIHRRVD
jgi:hypothetical protein